MMYVYEIKDETGNFVNSAEVQLVDTSRESAEKRALELVGNDKRKSVFIKKIIENFEPIK